MSRDVKSQLAGYGRYLEDAAPPIALEEYQPVRTVPLREQAPPPRPPRFRRAAAMAGAALAALVLIGAAALIFFDTEAPVPEPAATTVPPTTAPSKPTTEAPLTTAPAPPPPVEPVPSPAQPFVATVASAPNTATRVAVTPDGGTLIAFVDEQSSLRLVRCENPACDGPATLFETILSGRYFDLDVRDDGSPVLLHSANGGGLLVTCHDPDCTAFSQAAVEALSVYDLAVGPGGGAPVVLLERGDNLEIVRCASPRCDALSDPTVVGPGDVGATLAISPGGAPAAAFWHEADGARGEFVVMRCETVDCSSFTTSGSLGLGPAPETNAILIVPSDNVPVVAYVDAVKGPRTLRCGEPACLDRAAITLGAPIPVPDAHGLGAAHSEDLGSLVVTFIGSGRLSMAVCTDATCSEVTVRELSGCACEPPALVIRADGNPVVSLSDAGGVKILTCADATCGPGATVAAPAPPSPTPEPIPAGGGEWTQISRADTGFGTEVGFNGLVVTEFGLIASGLLCEPECASAAWISDDGASWRRVDAPGAFDADDVVSGGPGLVALVHKTPEGAEPEITYDSLVYASSDGTTWTLVEDFGRRAPTGPGGPAGVDVQKVFRGAAGLVAYGFDDTGLVIWTSANADAWVRVLAPPDGFFAGTPLPARSVAGMAFDGGRYFMWGSMFSGDDEPFDMEIAVWRSADLVTWEYIGPTDGESPTSLLTSAVVWQGAIVVRGARCDEGGQCPLDADTFWASSDGETWQSAAADASVFFEWRGDLFPMRAQLGALTDDSRGRAIWTSTDGLGWAFVDEVLAPIDEVVYVDGGFVGVGNSDENATAWVWSASG